MKKLFPPVCLAWLLCLPAFLMAQSGAPVFENVEVEVTYAQKLGTTPPLRNLVPQPMISPEKRVEVKKNKKIVPNFSGRRLHYDLNPNALPQGPDPVWQSEINRDFGMTIEPIVNRNGMTQANFGGSPPDPCGDIGKEYYIQEVNASLFRVHFKDGMPASGPIATNTIWNSIGFSSSGDPIVLYDQAAERWIITEFPSGNQLLVAVSDTSDPLGTWTAYNFATPNFPDYPKYAIWENALVVTTNEQGPGTLPAYFIDREALLNGDPAPMVQRIQLPGVGGGPGFQVATPVDWTGFQTPAADAKPMILALSDDAWGATAQDLIRMFSFDLDFENPANTTMATLEIPTAPFDTNPCSAPGPNFGCIPQLGGQGIDGLPEVIMHQVHYRNFGTHESIVLNFITDATGTDVSGIRWVELRRTPGEAWSVFQEGTYAPNDGKHRFMGGIAIDGAGNIGLAYSISSPDSYPGIGVTGRRKNDPPGEMTFDEFIATEGFSPSPGGRFGDYAQMTIDPYDDRTFWYTGEYMGTNGWSTRIISFNLGRDTNDIAPITMLTPQSSSALTDAESIQIEVKNVGIDTQYAFNVGFVFENDTAVVESVDTLLAPDSVYVHTFAKTVNMSAIGDYHFKLFTAMASDEVQTNDTLRVVVSKLPRYDAAITNIEGLNDLTCGDTIPFGFLLTNMGTDTLTSATIDIELNGANFLTSDWTGILPAGASDLILSELTGILNGNNHVKVSVSMPNGMPDQMPQNDSLARDFQVITDGVSIILKLKTDNFPDETTWTLSDAAGTVLFSGGPYNAPQTEYTEVWCLDPEACYTFTISDSYGDGMNSPGPNDGYYEITDAFGNTLANIMAVNFGFSETNDFCAKFQCMMEADVEISPESSAGANDGTLMIIPLNGVAPFQYSIDSGMTFQPSNFFDNLAAGDYQVVVLGEFDCEYHTTVTVPACAMEVMANITNESATNAGDGAIEVVVTNGTPPYKYSLNGGSLTTWPVFSNLSTGDYTVKVIDALGCEFEGVFMVDIETAATQQFAGRFMEVLPNPTDGLFRINLKGWDSPRIQLPIEIYNSTGQKVQNFQLVRYNDTYTALISLVAYPDGVYYVRFLDENISRLIRVVKQ
ncbi:MAG: T9SS C-terminal target domain-containing protein [Bacteroidetes bacterium]|nr:MAG: T9SS C-terminal target domain-containing protein [Bacteroidota bacterium]